MRVSRPGCRTDAPTIHVSPRHCPTAALKRLEADVARLSDQVKALVNTARLHPKDVMARYGFSKSTLYRLLARGLLPKPVRFTGPLWPLADLEAAEKAGQLPPPKAGHSGTDFRLNSA
jgi:predicted DNA-binding transcriptional regulator AlpA